MDAKPFRLPAPHNTTCEYKDKPCAEPAFWTVWRSSTIVVGHYCKNHSGRMVERAEAELRNEFSQRS